MSGLDTQSSDPEQDKGNIRGNKQEKDGNQAPGEVLIKHAVDDEFHQRCLRCR